MNKLVKNSILTFFLIVFALCFFILYRGSSDRYREITCKGINVEFADSYRFVTAKEVKELVDREYGKYIGQRLVDVKLTQIEDIIKQKSAVKKCDAYVSSDGTLGIKVLQRKPLLKINLNNKIYYSDETGFIFPEKRSYGGNIMYVYGKVPLHIPTNYSGIPKNEKEYLWLQQITDLVKLIYDSKKWRNLFSKMRIERNKDIILLPDCGKEKFIIGPATNTQNKLDKIDKYYKFIVPDKGEGYYSSINLKFNDQIICRRH